MPPPDAGLASCRDMRAHVKRTVVVLGPHGGRRWAAEYAASRVETELPYGAECLRQHGLEVSYPSFEDGRVGSIRAVRSLTRRLHETTALPVLPALGTAPEWLRADAVVAMFEDNGFSMAPLLRARRRVRGPGPTSVVVACWVAEKAVSASFHVLRRYARMLSAFDHVVCFSSNQADLLHRRLDVPMRRIRVTTFGCRTSWFSEPGDIRREAGLVVAVGNDVGRDYGTFVAAVEGAPARALLVTNSWHAARLRPSAHVEVVTSLDRRDYRDVLRRAAVVVVPTFALAYPTGQSVLIEAMASGCACVVTASPSLRDYVQHGRNAVLVPPGDAEAMSAAITSLVEDPERCRSLGDQARADAQDKHDNERMWADIAAVSTRRHEVAP
jgi:glycosyltransferase involved in cell wall biosynthesis